RPASNCRAKTADWKTATDACTQGRRRRQRRRLARLIDRVRVSGRRLSHSDFDESESAMVGRKKDPKYYGLMAMYADAEALIEAARQTRDAGYRHIDAYTPFPVHGLAEAVGFRRTKLPAIVLCGCLTGAA